MGDSEAGNHQTHPRQDLGSFLRLFSKGPTLHSGNLTEPHLFILPPNTAGEAKLKERPQTPNRPSLRPQLHITHLTVSFKGCTIHIPCLHLYCGFSCTLEITSGRHGFNLSLFSLFMFRLVLHQRQRLWAHTLEKMWAIDQILQNVHCVLHSNLQGSAGDDSLHACSATLDMTVQGWMEMDCINAWIIL